MCHHEQLDPPTLLSESSSQGIMLDYRMISLPIAASDNTRDIEPPKSGPEFESLCRDVFPFIQKKHDIPILNSAKNWYSVGYGQNGDRQNGVDLLDFSTYATAQCKNQEKFNLPKLKKELNKLKKYDREITCHFFLISEDQTPVKVLDYILSHNEELERNYLPSTPYPAKPSVYLPKLFILNWVEIKAVLSSDYNLSSKWGLRPFDSKYSNLSYFDINRFDFAVNHIKDRLAANASGKAPDVRHAIQSLTEGMDKDEIRAIGIKDRILSSTIDRMKDFVNRYDETISVAEQYFYALKRCKSLDMVTRHQGYETLNKIVLYCARIEGARYLNKLRSMVAYLIEQIDDENLYAPDVEPIEYENGYIEQMENWGVRNYNFFNVDNEFPPFYIPSAKISKVSGMIANELSDASV